MGKGVPQKDYTLRTEYAGGTGKTVWIGYMLKWDEASKSNKIDASLKSDL